METLGIGMDEVAALPDVARPDDASRPEHFDRQRQLCLEPGGTPEGMVQPLVAGQPVLRGIFPSRADRDRLLPSVPAGACKQKLAQPADGTDRRVPDLSVQIGGAGMAHAPGAGGLLLPLSVRRETAFAVRTAAEGNPRMDGPRLDRICHPRNDSPVAFDAHPQFRRSGRDRPVRRLCRTGNGGEGLGHVFPLLPPHRRHGGPEPGRADAGGAPLVPRRQLSLCNPLLRPVPTPFETAGRTGVRELNEKGRAALSDPRIAGRHAS